MSGSDGKLFRDYTAGAPTETACDMLFLQTQLASPKADVVEQMRLGDTLQITLDNAHPERIALAIWNGHIAGGIASPKVLRLIACIESGTYYVAQVIEKIGGQITLNISPVKE